MNKKNNIFFWSPRGYGPHITKVSIDADHIECSDEDDWVDAADDYYDENLRDTDYGIFYFSRKDAEKLLKSLTELLKEEHE